MSETKVKQEVDEVPLFELFLIVKRKTGESNLFAFNECRIWSEINRLNCTVNDRKLARFQDAVYISRTEDGRRELSEGLRVIFGQYS